jgi:hypothetical protein
MGKYWLDADVLIQAENTFYAFQIARPFWAFIVREAEAGRICSSTRIYREILRYEDKGNDLVSWAKEHRNSGLFAEPERAIQEAFTEVADYVTQQYRQRPAKVAEFLKGGDGWIIAHAYCDGGTVVSHENRLDSASLTPKIPNVCHNFGVGCIGLPAMLKQLKFTFGA